MGSQWDAAVYRGRLHYRDEMGKLELPLPRLAGPHQPLNAALAVAMLRNQTHIPVTEAALKAAPLWAHWPARLQRLDSGPLVARLPEGSTVWLDGGHNAAAGEMLGQFLDELPADQEPLHLIVGMLANKDVDAFLSPLRGKVSHIHALPVPAHAYHPPGRFEAVASDWTVDFTAHDDVEQAVSAIATGSRPASILIAGSLYLAGDVLLRNAQLPD